MSDNFQDLHPALTPQAALVEATRCLYCYDAPCAAACPTHIDVPKFIKKIASGNLRGSATAILDANILGLSCSRVCPVDVLCEGACVLHRYNKQPIEIGLLQRHAVEWFYDHSPSVAVGADNGKHRRRTRVAGLRGGASPVRFQGHRFRSQSARGRPEYVRHRAI
jgi:glutamate synthase (NADPH/NADH) small chain